MFFEWCKTELKHPVTWMHVESSKTKTQLYFVMLSFNLPRHTLRNDQKRAADTVFSPLQPLLPNSFFTLTKAWIFFFSYGFRFKNKRIIFVIVVLSRCQSTRPLTHTRTLNLYHTRLFQHAPFFPSSPRSDWKGRSLENSGSVSQFTLVISLVETIACNVSSVCLLVSVRYIHYSV